MVFSPGNWIMLLWFHVVSPLKGDLEAERGVTARMTKSS